MTDWINAVIRFTERMKPKTLNESRKSIKRTHYTESKISIQIQIDIVMIANLIQYICMPSLNGRNVGESYQKRVTRQTVFYKIQSVILFSNLLYNILFL